MVMTLYSIFRPQNAEFRSVTQSQGKFELGCFFTNTKTLFALIRKSFVQTCNQSTLLNVVVKRTADTPQPVEKARKQALKQLAERNASTPSDCNRVN